jgi:DnaJ-class molecular chaperone
MPNQPDPYTILGVNPNASIDDIRHAYRKLAFQHHPDMNQMNLVASHIMQRINDAYAIISDPVKRKEYDLSLGNLNKLPKYKKGDTVKINFHSASPHRNRVGTIEQEPVKDTFRYWYLVNIKSKGFSTDIRVPEEEVEKV